VTNRDGAIAGIAVYRIGALEQVHHVGVPKIVEYGGRSWQLDRTVDSTGTSSISLRKDDPEHVLVGYVVDGTIDVSTTGDVARTGLFDHFDVLRSHIRQDAALSGVMLPGTGTYRVSWSDTEKATGAILVYRLRE
jgi:hypothetical protein